MLALVGCGKLVFGVGWPWTWSVGWLVVVGGGRNLRRRDIEVRLGGWRRGLK